MKVFLSWSGSPSKEIAEVLNRYIPDIIQEAEPFYSPDSINKGEKWSSAINGELSSSNFGILCITKNNFRSDWINYEAGALTKPVEKSKICPLLFDMLPSDITHSPLTMYQMTTISNEDMFKLFQSINSSCERPMNDDRLKRAYERVWNDIVNEFENIRQKYNSEEDIEHVANSEDMIREILDTVRKLDRNNPALKNNSPRRSLLNIITYTHEAIVFTKRTLTIAELVEIEEYINSKTSIFGENPFIGLGKGAFIVKFRSEVELNLIKVAFNDLLKEFIDIFQGCEITLKEL